MILSNDLSCLSNDELRQKAADLRGQATVFENELNKRRLADRAKLAEFMLQHRDMFVLFFRLGGCVQPEAAVESLTESYQLYRPMAYAQKDEIPEVVHHDA